MSDMLQNKLTTRLSVDTELGAFLGNTRIRLLEAIDQSGSISQAAKLVPLSYKAAWDAVDAMNNLAEHPLVLRATGGKHGGGTTLTDYGRKIVAMFRAVEQEYQMALDRLAHSMEQVDGANVHQFQTLMRRMAVRASARNQFAGTIVAMREGAVNFEVCLRIDTEHELVAMITRESAENMELGIGSEVVALVKAPAVILMAVPDVRTSARNQLWGEIVTIHPGAVNSEVVLALPSGKTIVSIVTVDSVNDMALEVGGHACAIFDATNVILLTYA